MTLPVMKPLVVIVCCAALIWPAPSVVAAFGCFEVALVCGRLWWWFVLVAVLPLLPVGALAIVELSNLLKALAGLLLLAAVLTVVEVVVGVGAREDAAADVSEELLPLGPPVEASRPVR